MFINTKYLQELSKDSGIIGLTNFNAHKCTSIASIVIIQCIAVFVGSVTILYCVWNPCHATMDYDKLARIMYLYDSEACETRYIKASIAVHIAWMSSAIAVLIFIKSVQRLKILKIVLAFFFYISIFIIFFDVSMAIVYVAHIQQSLTKGMIIRYSGWSVDMTISNYDDFAGWLPIMASVCWMRGVFILALNMFMCKVIYRIRRKIQTREFRLKMMQIIYLPIPKAELIHPDRGVLHFRTGQHKPHIKREFSYNYL